MFQRLKGAIDARIAEEQARQRSLQSSPSRSNSVNRRPAGRVDSPASRGPGGAARRSSTDGNATAPSRGPDPREFEPEFVIGDEETPSRAGTPQPTRGRMRAGTVPSGDSESKNDTKPAAAGASAAASDTTEANKLPAEAESTELPQDVKAKLRKLDRLEPRYHELLRSYRIAHARVTAIEPFEAALRENTPLTSISDPGALIEYVNQLGLKSDMVLEELKRVTGERDAFKAQAEEAETRAQTAVDEVAALKAEKSPKAPLSEAESSAPRADTKENPASPTSTKKSLESVRSTESPSSPTTPTKSKSGVIPGLSMLSTPFKARQDKPMEPEGEDLFSFDSEIPRLESELDEQEATISSLRDDLSATKRDLSVAQESTQSMALDLEKATRDVTILREQCEQRAGELQQYKKEAQDDIGSLTAQLEAIDAKLRQAQVELETNRGGELNSANDALKAARTKIQELEATQMQAIEAQQQLVKLQQEVKGLQEQLDSVNATRNQDAQTINRLERELAEDRSKLQAALAASSALEISKSDAEARLQTLQNTPQHTMTPSQTEPEPDRAKVVNGSEEASGTAQKRKKNKKRKGAKASSESAAPQTEANSPVDGPRATTDSLASADSMTDAAGSLRLEIERLEKTLADKEAIIETLNGKARLVEELREEIESLRDELVHVGQDHMDAKEQNKTLQEQKTALDSRVTELSRQLAELQTASAADKEVSQSHTTLASQFEELKLQSSNLETDLKVAQQLASTRFKDLTEMRSILQKAQPEMIALREENTELKSVRDQTTIRVKELEKIESKHELLRAETTELKRRVGEKDAEMRTLSSKLVQAQSDKNKSNDAYERGIKDMKRIEDAKAQALQSLERAQRELKKSREEIDRLQGHVRRLESSVSQLDQSSKSLKEDLDLKVAQYASAESLMTSMRDQSTEMATQKREAVERCESLEEEVADTQRLLSERSREAETMRRLLADVEGRADARIREMRERMDAAIEERDRAEADASTAGRRQMRELEDLRTKLRDMERDVQRTADEKDELQTTQRDQKRRRDELERRAETSAKEVEDVRRAMSSLRDALDDSERQARELERQKDELRRTVGETQQRLDRLQKTNKILADEVKTAQVKAKARAADTRGPSTRTSVDLSANRNAASSSPRQSTTLNGASSSDASQDYLKNILLQFLEQKDKKHQMQLVPVLGMLLHFDRHDEEKWMAAISSRP